MNKAVAKSPDDPGFSTIWPPPLVVRATFSARKELQTVIDPGQKFMDPQVPERMLADLG